MIAKKLKVVIMLDVIAEGADGLCNSWCDCSCRVSDIMNCQMTLDYVGKYCKLARLDPESKKLRPIKIGTTDAERVKCSGGCGPGANVSILGSDEDGDG